MVNSKKPAANSALVSHQPSVSPRLPVYQPLPAHEQFIQQVQFFLADCFKRRSLENPHLLLALSGGVDSMVLLHLLVNLRQTFPFSLTALHVHHGLSMNADRWAQFCVEICKRWQVPLTINRVQIDQSGLGLEAAARVARYQALTSQKADFICLAHHQDDQAETVLLQLARGAGVKGLAAMAPYDAKRKLLRPLLTCRRVDLVAYAQLYRLKWVEDESNADARYDRNFMRHQLIPVFEQRYPAIRQTLARTAGHLAEATSLCDDLANIDASEAIGTHQQYPTLNLAELSHLSPARQANLLRWWLAQQELNMPSSAQLQQILHQAFHAATDTTITVKVSQDHSLKRYQQHLYLVKTTPTFKAINMIWQDESELVLPDQSRLIMRRDYGLGLALQRTEDHVLSVKNRQGGEYLTPEIDRPSRSLKYLFNEATVPPWLRQSWPLLYANDKLIMIPNIAMDVNLKASPDELGWQIDWVDAAGRLMWAQ